MHDDTVRSDRSQERKSIPKQRPLQRIIESKPVHKMEYRRQDNDDVAYPPEELLVLEERLETLFERLGGEISSRGGTGLCGGHLTSSWGKWCVNRGARKGWLLERVAVGGGSWIYGEAMMMWRSVSRRFFCGLFGACCLICGWL